MTTPRVKRADGSVATCMTGLGTFSDYMTLDQSSVVKVETDVPDEQLALIGCGVTTGVGAALNTAKIVPGSSVAVIGCGGVGQSVIQGARIAGAGHIIAIDPVELKRKTAEQLGATDLVDPSDGNAVEAVKALTGGRGADYAFEVIGLPETIQQAYKSARRGGTVVVVGMPRVDAMVNLSAWGLFYDEKRTLGCYYGSAQVRGTFPDSSNWWRPAASTSAPWSRDASASTRSMTRSGRWRPVRSSAASSSDGRNAVPPVAIASGLDDRDQGVGGQDDGGARLAGPGHVDLRAGDRSADRLVLGADMARRPHPVGRARGPQR